MTDNLNLTPKQLETAAEVFTYYLHDEEWAKARIQSGSDFIVWLANQKINANPQHPCPECGKDMPFDYDLEGRYCPDEENCGYLLTNPRQGLEW